ncbi:MAG: methyl-accepting chemotaxis protein [Syntrophales bacterium]|nr:methyl-accepting chemotaxis protein [Syntrophales bacterium]MDD5233174.1 methyl-accepting chemotaxis protein [Syntrophales bacterium]MDD5533021.1 methyl-accepting chemotaxis protein [Syntrophales bacterium]
MFRNMGLRGKMFSLLTIFILLFAIMGAFTILTIQEKVILTAHEKLKGDIAMGRSLLEDKHPGAWAVREGKLFKGETEMNGNFGMVDRIGELTGDTVTIFQDGTRIATNVKNASGERAVGTKAARNVIDKVLKEGKSYIGKAQVVGIWNQTAYEPIRDEQGQVIGMFYVGVPNTRYDQIVEEIIKKLSIMGLVGILIVFALGYFIVRSITGSVGRVITGLTGGVDEVISASAQVSSSAQQLARGAGEQAGSLEETASSLDEMSAMTKQNAENADHARVIMEEVNRIVENVNQQMDRMSEAISEIRDSNAETGKIIQTIEAIAFQTNLLALNAAVEAARAGEIGAGFAVVADEVRNLAMRAAEAAKTTNELIENTVKAVVNGSELTQTAKEAFKENMEISTKVSQLVNEIAAASKEQAEGIGNVHKAIAEIDKVTQQTASHAEQSADASDRLNDQIGKIRNNIQDLVSAISGAGKTDDEKVRRFEDAKSVKTAPAPERSRISGFGLLKRAGLGG